jgi:hypothetical protein
MNATKIKLRGGRLGVWLATGTRPINFAVTARVRGTFTPGHFQNALDKIRLKYPPLNSRVSIEADGQPYLIPADELDFSVRILAREHENRWGEEVIRELTRLYDMQRELPARFVLLRGDQLSDIIIVCPHALADGYSAVFVMRDLLLYLGNPDADVEPMRLYPSLSELIPDVPGKRMAVLGAKIKGALFKLQVRLTSKKDEKPEIIGASTKPNYYFLSWELTPQQTSALVSRSRAEGASVHASLCTAFLRSFGEFYGDGWNRKIQSPVDLRKRLTQPVDESFGLYVNLVEFYVDCAPERDFWEVARQIKVDFVHHAGGKSIFSASIGTIVLMETIAPVATFENISTYMPKVEYDLSISNLGRLDFPTQYGPLELEALYGPTITGIPEEIVLGVITAGDKMHFTMVYTDVKLNATQAEQIKEKAMAWLADATQW